MRRNSPLLLHVFLQKPKITSSQVMLGKEFSNRVESLRIRICAQLGELCLLIGILEGYVKLSCKSSVW